MPGMTPLARIAADAAEVPVLGQESEQNPAVAAEVTVARLLACNASVAAVSEPPE